MNERYRAARIKLLHYLEIESVQKETLRRLYYPLYYGLKIPAKDRKRINKTLETLAETHKAVIDVIGILLEGTDNGDN